MKRLTILFAVLAVFLWLIPMSASAITIDGDMADWGISSLHGFNIGGGEGPGSPITGSQDGVFYWEEEGYGSQGWLEPGYGGTPYDIMSFYVKKDATNLYIGVITGFFPSSDNHLGDIGIDKDGDGVYEYGIDTTTGSLFTALSGDNWSPVFYTATPNDFSSSNPDDIIGGDRGAPTDNTSTFYYGSAQLDGATSSDLYSLEVQIALVDIGGLDGGAAFHLTEWCGNDAANLNVNPVPEPATMLLFGTGLIGLAAVGRKKFRKQG